jgi:hypothetical protein
LWRWWRARDAADDHGRLLLFFFGPISLCSRIAHGRARAVRRCSCVLRRRMRPCGTRVKKDEQEREREEGGGGFSFREREVLFLFFTDVERQQQQVLVMIEVV